MCLFLRPYVESDVHTGDDSAQPYVHEGDISPECILAKRVRDGCVEYCVQWRDDDEDTWETEQFCRERCPRLLEDFESLPCVNAA